MDPNLLNLIVIDVFFELRIADCAETTFVTKWQKVSSQGGIWNGQGDQRSKEGSFDTLLEKILDPNLHLDQKLLNLDLNVFETLGHVLVDELVILWRNLINGVVNLF